MGITSTGSVGTGPASDATRGSAELGKDQFVQLLMAQLRNQDPTSPMDGQAFVAQLAQFAGLEQLQGVSSRLDALVLAQAASNQTQTASLVGRDVLFRSDAVHLAGTGPVAIGGQLEAPAASVTATIRDADGRTVRTITLAGASSGEVALSWDGRDDAGVPLPPGDYTVALVAADLEGNPVDVEPRGRGHVTGVSFANGYPELIVDGRKVKLSDVLELSEPSPAPPATA